MLTVLTGLATVTGMVGMAGLAGAGVQLAEDLDQLPVDSLEDRRMLGDGPLVEVTELAQGRVYSRLASGRQLAGGRQLAAGQLTAGQLTTGQLTTGQLTTGQLTAGLLGRVGWGDA